MPIISGSSTSGGTQGTEIGYDQITTLVNVASVTEATPTTIITCAAHTFDGAPVYAQFCGTIVIGSVAPQVTVVLFEGATEIDRLGTYGVAAAGTTQALTVTYGLRFTPTAASHTYTVGAFAPSAAGTQAQVGGGVGGTAAPAPCFIRFTKV